MNLQEFEDCQKHHNALLFKITSRCNDFCKFCIEYKFIKSRRADLSLKEIKDNYFYFKDKFKIDYIILTGGEPTLHLEFFEIIDFFKKQGIGFRVITNLLKFNETNFLEEFKPFFLDFKNKEQENLTRVIVSINDLPGFHPSALKRMNGLRKALKYNLPLMVTVVIYQDNLEYLPRLALYLKKLFEKNVPSITLYIEFRLLYIEGTLDSLLKKSLPRDFNRLKYSMEEVVNILDSSKVRLSLWNFPLCYINNSKQVQNTGIDNKLARRFIKINKDLQFKDVEVRNWEAYLKYYPECKKCKLKNICSGVDKYHIQKYNYPPLSSF